MEFQKANEYKFCRIASELPPFLYYNSYKHVLNVYASRQTLQNPTYFTQSAKKSRQSKKLQHLQKVKHIVESF